MAQDDVHYRQSATMPPGAIGSEQLTRGGPLPGYFQPVEVKAPAGALVSLAANNDFLPASPTPFTVGMLIAPVYRLRVTQIANYPGQEVFPTIEVINRLYPPPDQAKRFPIEVEISQEDLQLALEGHYVTRVIYLEDPASALPIASGPETNWFEAAPGQDPLRVADSLGRPMAILRMGGRVPADRSQIDAHFLYGCPPFVVFHPIAPPAELPPPSIMNSAQAMISDDGETR